MPGMITMIKELQRRLFEVYRTLVIDNTRGLWPPLRLLVFLLSFFCFPVVTVILSIIVLIVLLIALPLSFVFGKG